MKIFKEKLQLFMSSENLKIEMIEITTKDQISMNQLIQIL